MPKDKPMTPNASTSRDLIMVTSHRENFATLEPFVLSLKRSGFQGSTAIFVSGMDDESVSKLRSHGVIIVPFHFSGKGDRQRLARLWPLWRWYFSTGASLSKKIRLAHRVFHMRYLRYLLYAEFLREHAADFDRVLLSDGKDVFFQRDPFAWDWAPGAHFFLEDATKRIGDCRLHRLWLGCQFGEAFVEQNAGRTPSCSGTTFGDMAAIRQYVDVMIATIMQARNLAKISGGDQGIHNYVMICNLLNNIVVRENRRGPVLTMGVLRETDFKTDTTGAVLNENGETPPVLHQYDRIPSLKERLLKSLNLVHTPITAR
jgi:hypothetical protein